eukprot:125090-Pelagomonas_calceolata.AAC.2
MPCNVDQLPPSDNLVGPLRGWSIWVNRERSDQDSIRAAGGPISLIRNAGVKVVGRYNTVRDSLSECAGHADTAWLGGRSQTACIAYIHL